MNRRSFLKNMLLGTPLLIGIPMVKPQEEHDVPREYGQATISLKVSSATESPMAFYNTGGELVGYFTKDGVYHDVR